MEENKQQYELTAVITNVNNVTRQVHKHHFPSQHHTEERGQVHHIQYFSPTVHWKVSFAFLFLFKYYYYWVLFLH